MTGSAAGEEGSGLDIRLLVTLLRPTDAETVRGTGCEALAEYPDSVLVRCTAA